MDNINSHRQAFEKFDAQNPHVFQLFKQFAEQMRASGRKHYGAMGIINQIRWHMALKTTDEEFKINNNYAPYYARKLADSDARFRDFFRMRRVRGEVRHAA